MKRYSISSTNLALYAQFPAKDKNQAFEQAQRHAGALGITDEYRVIYRGKWQGDDNPESYTVVAA